MKRKILISLLMLSLFVGGVVTASSINGDYKGMPIVRLLSNGKQLTVADVPAVIDHDRTMVPLYMLRQIGMEVTWDGDTYTVDARMPVALSDAQITEISKNVGKVLVYKDGAYVGQGSGFLLPGGVFITNDHVGAAGNRLEIQLNGHTYTTNGESLFKNETTDVFGVRITASGGLKVNAAKPKIGTHVVAIGYPKGQYAVTRGWITATTDYHGLMTINHSAQTDHGSSGGALLDEDGEVIGITTAGFDGTIANSDSPFFYVQQELDKLK